MGESNKEGSVHQVRDKKKGKGKIPTKPDKPCYRCGKKGHEPQQCRFRKAMCYNCQKEGHIKEASRSKGKKATPNSPNKRQSLRKKTMMMLTGYD